MTTTTTTDRGWGTEGIENSPPVVLQAPPPPPPLPLPEPAPKLPRRDHTALCTGDILGDNDPKCGSSQLLGALGFVIFYTY